jgi:hypothetical protein
MVRLLNNLLIVFFLVTSAKSFSQSDVSSIYAPADYKNKSQFQKFYRHRTDIAKWQINQLKKGALMVRLRTNQKTIDMLLKAGNADMATQKKNETFIVNKNIVRAYTTLYTFSKVYFFYSNNSDTLSKGARTGIFLDTNLNIDPKIVYNENYYLIAERDDAYNSSIGFVKEDTARFIKETGNPVKEMAIIIKNKFGHQLKEPFPYLVYPSGSESAYVDASAKNADGTVVKGQVLKRYTSKKCLMYANKLNDLFRRFYDENKDYEVTDPNIKPFLY